MSDDTENNIVPFIRIPPTGISTNQTPQKPANKPPDINFAKGDWIRYYGQENGLSIGQVEYIITKMDQILLCTEKGIVPSDRVVELRKGK